MPLYRRKPVTVHAFKLPPKFTLRAINIALPDWFIDRKMGSIDQEGIRFEDQNGERLARWGEWVIENTDKTIEVMVHEDFEADFHLSPVREAA